MLYLFLLLFWGVLGIKLRTFCMLRTHCATELHPQPHLYPLRHCTTCPKMYILIPSCLSSEESSTSDTFFMSPSRLAQHLTLGHGKIQSYVAFCEGLRTFAQVLSTVLWPGGKGKNLSRSSSLPLYIANFSRTNFLIG